MDIGSTITDSSELFQELLARLELTDEVTRIEVKEGSSLGSSGLETISALSNEPGLGGGYVIFGLRAVDQTATGRRYEIIGVPEPDRLQSEISTACASQFSSVIRPSILAESVRIGGGTQTVVVVQIPEALDADKPVFISSCGVHQGSFRRIGSTDQVCRQEDFERFALARAGRTPDTLQQRDIDVKRLKRYAAHRIRKRFKRFRAVQGASLRSAPADPDFTSDGEQDEIRRHRPQTAISLPHYSQPGRSGANRRRGTPPWAPVGLGPRAREPDA